MTWLLDLVLSDLPFPGIYRDEQNILQMRSVWHRVCVCVCVCESHSGMVSSLNLMDCILPGSSVHGALQARIL